MLSEGKYCIISLKSKEKTQNLKKQNRLVVTRGRELAVGEMVKVVKKYKLPAIRNVSWGWNMELVAVASNAVLHA